MKTKLIVFFGIILVGLVISLFTLNKCEKVEVVDDGNGGAQKPPVTDTGKAPENGQQTKPGESKGAAKATAKGKGTSPEKTEPTPPEKTEAPPAKFASAEALMGELSSSVKKRDAKRFLEVAGPEAATPLVQAQVTKLITDKAYSLDEERPSAQIAKVAGSFSRWAVRLEQSDDAAAVAALPENAPKIAEIYTDLAKDDQNGWKIAKLGLPLEVAGFLGNDMPAPTVAQTDTPATPAPAGNAPGTPTAPKSDGKSTPKEIKPAPASGVDSADALTVAHAFSKAIVESEFESARRLTDAETISVERLAALMIAVEEGKFGLKEEEPLVVTLNRENIVWVLTRLSDSGNDTDSEFAAEMAKMDDGEWKINGLAFNQLLTALAAKAGAGGSAYAPMIENPQGGESLVIYFDFDNAAVSSRSNRQIEIIANILKQDPERELRINGHADALGTDDYNRALSDKRSAAVRNALINNGVNPKQIITEAYGESQPLRPNFKNDGTDDPDGRSLNRRAEVYLDF